jgi:hypothetical protein
MEQGQIHWNGTPAMRIAGVLVVFGRWNGSHSGGLFGSQGVRPYIGGHCLTDCLDRGWPP